MLMVMSNQFVGMDRFLYIAGIGNFQLNYLICCFYFFVEMLIVNGISVECLIVSRLGRIEPVLLHN